MDFSIVVWGSWSVQEDEKQKMLVKLPDMGWRGWTEMLN